MNPVKLPKMTENEIADLIKEQMQKMGGVP